MKWKWIQTCSVSVRCSTSSFTAVLLNSIGEMNIALPTDLLSLDVLMMQRCWAGMRSGDCENQSIQYDSHHLHPQQTIQGLLLTCMGASTFSMFLHLFIFSFNFIPSMCIYATHTMLVTVWTCMNINYMCTYASIFNVHSCMYYNCRNLHCKHHIYMNICTLMLSYSIVSSFQYSTKVSVTDFISCLLTVTMWIMNWFFLSVLIWTPILKNHLAKICHYNWLWWNVKQDLETIFKWSGWGHRLWTPTRTDHRLFCILLYSVKTVNII